MDEWPANLYYDFAFFLDRTDRLRDLTKIAEPEDWGYQHTESEFDQPILFNYLGYTYRRIAKENKIALSENAQHCCFNTGLVTSVQEELYAVFEVNRREGAQAWFFLGWHRSGDRELNRFSQLPDLARYFDDPSDLVFDDRMDFRVNVQHIIQESRERFPEGYNMMNDFQLNTVLTGAIESAKKTRTKKLQDSDTSIL